MGRAGRDYTVIAKMWRVELGLGKISAVSHWEMLHENDKLDVDTVQNNAFVT